MVKKSVLVCDKKGFSRFYFEGKWNMLKSKRSLEMAYSTIIALILGLVLLVLLIMLLTGSFDNFKNKIGAFSSNSNVDLIVGNCNTLASNDAKFEYCCVNKTIVLSKTQKYELTCIKAINTTWGKDIEQLSCEGVC